MLSRKDRHPIMMKGLTPMIVRFHEYGFYGKSFRLDHGNFRPIRSLEQNTLNVRGNERLMIKDRFLKRAIIDLKAYPHDIDVYLSSVAGGFRGRVVAIVVPAGTDIDLFNVPGVS